MPSELVKLPTHWEHDVVVRRIDCSLADLLAAGWPNIGALNLSGPFVAGHDGFAASLHAPAVVQLRKLVLPARVNVRLVEWSSHSSELRIVPDSPHFDLWTEHRRQRYFDVVHDAADEIVRSLSRMPVTALV